MVYVIVVINLSHFVSHIPLIVFGMFLSLIYVRIQVKLQI